MKTNNKYVRFNIKYKKYIQTYQMPKYIYDDFITYVLEDKKRHKTNTEAYKQQKTEVKNSIQNILDETKHFRQFDNFTYYFNKLIYNTIFLKIKDMQKELQKLEEYRNTIKTL